MRKLDNFINNNFNGDKEKALEFLLYSSSDEKLSNYVSELTREEALIVALLMKKEAVKQYGSEKAYDEAIEKEQMLLSLNLTEEEVKNSKTNPYKAIFLKNCLKMLIMEGGIIALSIVAPTIGISAAALGIGASFATGLFSLTLASNLIDYVKFKKIKRNIEKENSVEVLDEGRKRGL